MDMISLDMKLAFQKPGCPICRLRYHAEQKYLFGFLWESVTDGGIRSRWLRSVGLCHDHAWLLQEIESSQWHDGMGTATVYESFLRLAYKEVAAYRKQAKWPAVKPPDQTSTWQRLRAGIRRFFFITKEKKQPITRLVPTAPCPACELGDRIEERYLRWLVRDLLKEETLRQAYETSDGLCLPHLQQALYWAKRENPAVGDLLLAKSEHDLGQRLAEIQEYLRKHSYQYHEETISTVEEKAWIRVIAWLVGEKRPAMHDSADDEREPAA